MQSNEIFMKSLFRHLYIGLFSFGIFFCTHQTAYAIWPFDDTNAPEKYFEGRALEIGRAIQKGDVINLKEAAAAIDLNAVGKQDMTLLFYAIVNQKYAAVTELIKAGANPAQTDKEFGSPSLEALLLHIRCNGTCTITNLIQLGMLNLIS
jgi:hypothetical protein